MTPERFRAIVEAYGAEARRWPAAERESALDWAERHRQEADALMAESAWLDARLASDEAPRPGDALYLRIVEMAPQAGRRTVAKKRRSRVWWSGAAFAGVGLAGGLAGALAVSFFVVTGSVPPPEHESSYLPTSFGGSAADWSGE
ncbi:hypothetical protein FAZ69_07485 [Trinickia terrae]|uniref:Uncharacterized protein n=1 Tax=Trinickia terrae TaxID=2571161 RepID=A0A4U1IC55_9BURK|nr:hypothetical protein [Trinickia terrae]TKC91192.1 hypothetical protein FAZ69_07485 [Trinickia terrae]